MKLRKGDNVIVMSGKEKGKKGKITKVYPGDFRVSVEGVNMRKKHRRPTRSGEKGQTIEKQNPIAVSSVRLLCSSCNKAVRVGFKMVGTRKVRICKKCGAEV